MIVIHLQNQMTGLRPWYSKGVYRQPSVGFFICDAQLYHFQWWAG